MYIHERFIPRCSLRICIYIVYNTHTLHSPLSNKISSFYCDISTMRPPKVEMKQFHAFKWAKINQEPTKCQMFFVYLSTMKLTPSPFPKQNNFWTNSTKTKKNTYAFLPKPLPLTPPTEENLPPPPSPKKNHLCH